MTKRCPYCGKDFITTNSRKTYCTRVCKDGARYVKAEEDEPRWTLPVDNSKEGRESLLNARKAAGLPLTYSDYDYSKTSIKKRRNNLAEINQLARDQHKSYGELQAEEYMALTRIKQTY